MNESDKEAIKQGYYLDEEAADRVRRFFRKYVKHSTSPYQGKPFELESWQWEQIIRPLYGWKRPDGRRRFQKCSVFTCKKVGKSFIGSALSLYHLVADNESGALCYLIANSVDQTKNVFTECCNIIDQSPELQQLLWTRPNINEVEYKAKHSRLKAFSGEKTGKRGKNWSFCCWDEITEPAPYQREIFGDLSKGGSTRTNPLFLTISTSGYSKECLGWEIYKQAKDIIEGKTINLHYLPVIIAADEFDDWQSETTWRKACPVLGSLIPLETYQQEAQEAKDNPRLQRDFQTYRLCQWVGSTQQYIPTHVWNRGQTSFKEEELYGKECWIGYDGARSFDLLAYVIIIPHNEKLYLVPRFFLPADNIDKRSEWERVDYRSWEAKNLITLTAGNLLDEESVIRAIGVDAKHFKIRQLSFDPNNAQLIMNRLRQDYGVNTVEIKQSYKSLSEPTLYFEKLVHENKLAHNHQILDWCLANTSLKRNTSNPDEVMLDKCGIHNDGIAALVIGLHGYMSSKKDCVYKSRGVLWI